MTARKAYQMALLASIGLGLVSSVIALVGFLSWAVAVLALSVVALAVTVHLRTRVMIERGGGASPALFAAKGAGRQESGSLAQAIHDLQRSQAASESFITADLLALRQRVNTLIEVTEASCREESP